MLVLALAAVSLTSCGITYQPHAGGNYGGGGGYPPPQMRHPQGPQYGGGYPPQMRPQGPQYGGGYPPQMQPRPMPRPPMYGGNPGYPQYGGGYYGGPPQQDPRMRNPNYRDFNQSYSQGVVPPGRNSIGYDQWRQRWGN